MANNPPSQSNNGTKSAKELADAANDTFKNLDKAVRQQLDERPYVVLACVFAVGWLYAKIR